MRNRNDYKKWTRHSSLILIVMLMGINRSTAIENNLNSSMISLNGSQKQNNSLFISQFSWNTPLENSKIYSPFQSNNDLANQIVLRDGSGSIGGLPDELPVKNGEWIMLYGLISYCIYLIFKGKIHSWSIFGYKKKSMDNVN